MTTLSSYLESSEEALRNLRDADLEATLLSIVDILETALSAGKPVLVCGNGGSASDAEHIAGELVGRFLKERPGYNVISLVSNAAVLTAWSNDYDYNSVFSRQVQAHGAKGGVLIGISTSGNSANVIAAAKQAQLMEMDVVSMTGATGGQLAEFSDVVLRVPAAKTALIQQGHMALYHYLCFVLEERLTEAC